MHAHSWALQAHAALRSVRRLFAALGGRSAVVGASGRSSATGWKRLTSGRRARGFCACGYHGGRPCELVRCPNLCPLHLTEGFQVVEGACARGHGGIHGFPSLHRCLEPGAHTFLR
eukprot:6868597-Alexandrium_andersonii.AAC.1